MCVGSPTAGTWSSSQWRPDDEFETDMGWRTANPVATALKQHPDEPLIVSLEGMLHAWRNQTDLALQSVRNALDCPRSFGHAHHTYYHIACVYAVIGDTDKAMAWLERAYEQHDQWMVYINSYPGWDDLRSEPRFQALVRRMNFPQ